MASIVYTIASSELGSTVIWASDTIKVALTSSSYVPNRAHEYFSDITNEIAGTGYTAGGKELEDKSSSGSEPTTYDGGDLTWTLLFASDIKYAIIYKDTGVAATSTLLACIDLGNDVDSLGGDFIIAWNTSGIFYTGSLSPGTYSQAVQITGDDGCTVNDFNFYNTTPQFGNASGDPRDAWFRFTNVDIPQGANVTSAKLTTTAFGNLSTTIVYTNIYLNDVDNAVAPTSAADHVAKVRTAEFVAYDNVAAQTTNNTYDTPDITAVVQEVLDRPGWESGNAMMVLIDDDGSSSGAYRRPYDYSETAAKATVLTINYGDVATGTYSATASSYETRVRLHARPRKTILDTYTNTDEPDKIWLSQQTMNYGDAIAFAVRFIGASAISDVTVYAYQNDVDVSATVLSGSNTIFNNKIISIKKFTPNLYDKYYVIYIKAKVNNKYEVRKLKIWVADNKSITDGLWIAESPISIVEGAVIPYSIDYYDNPYISSIIATVYRNGIGNDYSSTVMVSGDDYLISNNIVTLKEITAINGDGGSNYIVNVTTGNNGNTIVDKLLLRVQGASEES